MHLPRFVAAVSALLLLAGCTNTYHGLHDDYKDYERWAHNQPSRLNDSFGKIPRGYGGQNAEGVALLKPDGMGKVGASKYDWHESGDAPAITSPGPNVYTPYQANDSVTVYPIDGGPAQPLGGGTMEQQIFFRHGSARITPGERRYIGSVAESVRESNTGVTVVGHASTRVDGTSDPYRRKEINYNMGQKRADAVSGVLTDAGVDPGRVTAVTKGDDEPNPNPGSRSQEAADRRVDIYTNR
jgi:outer membrane protein OmpA-like peptidoglycan-associated protein